MSGPRHSKDGNEASWDPWRTAKTWALVDAAYLCCGRRPVTNEQRRLTKTAHEADVETMAQRLTAEVPHEKVPSRYWRHHHIIFERSAVETWAKLNGFRFPWEASATAPPSSATPTETLLKQVAVLALALAKTSERYRRGEKPNGAAIADAVQDILDGLPGASTRGLSSPSIRNSISAGLKLLDEQN